LGASMAKIGNMMLAWEVTTAQIAIHACSCSELGKGDNSSHPKQDAPH